jgi:hypothetical protein
LRSFHELAKLLSDRAVKKPCEIAIQPMDRRQLNDIRKVLERSANVSFASSDL